MRLAQRVQDPHLLSVAHEALGCTFYYLGELSAARTHVEQAMVLHDPQEHVRITMGTADRRLNFLSYAAWTLWQLGYPDQALAIVDKTGMRVSEAELYRIYGELALRMGERETGRTGEEEKIAHLPIHPFLSRGVLPQSHRHCPSAASQIPRTARGDESGAFTATARNASRITYHATRNTHDVIRDLRLVHRRV